MRLRVCACVVHYNARMLRRVLIVTLLLVIAFAAGGFAMLYARRPVYVPEPDGATLVTQMREVARLETLEVSMYKKINFEPDPKVGKTVWNDVVEWAKFAINQPKGKAIVFADVR